MSPVLPREFLEPVREHADFVLEARSTTERSRAPLFADAIDSDTGEALPYDGRDVADGRRLSNLAVQQEFVRALVALTTLTGTERYRDAAESVVEWAFDELTDSAGLLYWGGHTAYDLDAGEIVAGKPYHELKFEYPFYDFLREVDASATRRFVEAFWNAHVIDWANLDFNRHGDWDDSVGRLWDHTYEGGNVFFWGDGLTFVNTGSDLYYAGALLAAWTDDDAPLRWSRNLARRYVQTRQEPGISGYQFSQHPSYCNGPEIRGDRAQYQFAPYITGDHLVYEGTLFRPRPIVQRRQLELGARLGERGEAFTRWAEEELRAWRRGPYRPEDNEFDPILTDGRSLEGFVIRREGYFGPKGRIVEPIDCGPEFLWTYATAVRHTGDECCWRTARDIARGLGFGDIGSLEGDGGETSLATGRDDACRAYESLYAMLELYRATDRTAFLEVAPELGRQLLDERFQDDTGAFTDEHGRILLDDPVPLAMVHLAAVLDGQNASSLPTPVGTRGSSSGGF